MDATCADVRDLRDPTSSHRLHGGCESPLSVGNALFDHLSPAAKRVAEKSIVADKMRDESRVCSGMTVCTVCVCVI